MIRRLAVSAAAVGLAAATVLVPAAPAQAYPICHANALCVTSYYSDSTYTVLVGQIVNDYCAVPPSSSEWGTHSVYVRVTNTDC
jgi:hypothetical protein